MSRSWIFLLSALFVSAAHADESAYLCDTESVSELNTVGQLENTDFAKAVKMYSPRFAVDRKNGVVAGGPFATSDAKDVQVLDPGADTRAMQILWLSEAPYPYFKYLFVRSYADGPKKPFLGISGSLVITGTCE